MMPFTDPPPQIRIAITCDTRTWIIISSSSCSLIKMLQQICAEQRFLYTFCFSPRENRRNYICFYESNRVPNMGFKTLFWLVLWDLYFSQKYYIYLTRIPDRLYTFLMVLEHGCWIYCRFCQWWGGGVGGVENYEYCFNACVHIWFSPCQRFIRYIWKGQDFTFGFIEI